MSKLGLYACNVALATKRIPQSIAGDYVPRPGYSRVRNFWIAVDQWGNAMLGGDPNETISSRAAKARNAKEEWGCVLCQFLAFVTQSDHCTLSLEANEGQRAVIPDAVPPQD